MLKEKCPFEMDEKECLNCSYAKNGECSIEPLKLDSASSFCLYGHKSCEGCDFEIDGKCGLNPTE